MKYLVQQKECSSSKFNIALQYCNYFDKKLCIVNREKENNEYEAMQVSEEC